MSNRVNTSVGYLYGMGGGVVFPSTQDPVIQGDAAGQPAYDSSEDPIKDLQDDVNELFVVVKKLESQNAELRAEVDNLKMVIAQAVQRQSGQPGYWEES
jgi:hypothetical protein